MALNLDWLKKEKHSDKKAIRSDSMDFNASLPYDLLKWQYTIENKNYRLFNNRYKNDAIARRIVAKPAEDATRNGFRLVIPDNPEKQDKYQDALDKLLSLIHITFGIEETENSDADLQKPVNNNCIRDVTFVHAFGQTHISKSIYNDDPTDKNYQKEKSIRIRPTNSA